MLREIAVERYGFRCRHCDRAWSADYDVQYASDADGSLWAFYRLGGAAVENPTRDLILCPGCGRATVTVHLLARRDTPPAALSGADPRERVSSTAAQRRAAAPTLTAETPHDPAG